MPCRNPLDHSPHEYLADSDAINLSPCPGKGARMPETVMQKDTGKTAEVIGEYGDYYWLYDPNRAPRPWTSAKDRWGPPMPKAGDIWSSSAHDYRVLGVDEERKIYLIVPVKDYANGAWPNPNDASVSFGRGIQTDADVSSLNTVYVRAYPDEGLTLKERPEDW